MTVEEMASAQEVAAGNPSATTFDSRSGLRHRHRGGASQASNRRYNHSSRNSQVEAPDANTIASYDENIVDSRGREAATGYAIASNHREAVDWDGSAGSNVGTDMQPGNTRNSPTVEVYAILVDNATTVVQATAVVAAVPDIPLLETVIQNHEVTTENFSRQKLEWQQITITLQMCITFELGQLIMVWVHGEKIGIFLVDFLAIVGIGFVLSAFNCAILPAILTFTCMIDRGLTDRMMVGMALSCAEIGLMINYAQENPDFINKIIWFSFQFFCFQLIFLAMATNEELRKAIFVHLHLAATLRRNMMTSTHED